MSATLYSTLNQSAFDAFLKEVYMGKAPEEIASKDKPLLQYFPRDPGFVGDAYVVPVGIENPQGRSAVLSTALTNASSSQQRKFVASSRISDYAAIKILNETIKASKNNVGAFAEARKREVDGMLDTLGKSLHTALYRSGSGSIGQASNIVDGSSEATITFANKADVHLVGLGQTLQANNTDNATSMRAGSPQVIRRSVSAGTVTVDETVVATHSWGTTDFIFNADDADAKVSGLAGWLPLSAPSSSAWFGVDRTDDVTRLAGHRVDNANRSILENLQELNMLICEDGGKPDTVFMNPRAVHLLSQEVQTKVERMEDGVLAMGFTGFRLNSLAGGPVNIVQDWGCPSNRGYMLQKDSWILAHLEGLPHLCDEDGLVALRGATTDTLEVRARYWAQLMCRAPAYNGVFSVTVA